MSQVDEAREAVRDALHNRTQGFRTGGTGEPPFSFSVMGADEPIARELHERFGELIQIEVAGHPYPFDLARQIAPAPRRVSNSADFGLHVNTELEQPFRDAAPTGRIVTGSITIRNDSPSLVWWSLSCSVLDGDICDADGYVMNLRNSIGRGVGGGIRLEPRESCVMPFQASTDSRDPKHGAVLPAAEYLLFVAMRVNGNRQGEAFEVTCPALPIRLIN